MSDCLFCKIIAGQIPSEKVMDTEEFLAFRDITPQAPQHVLVIPKRHIERLADLKDNDADLMGKMMVEAAKLAHTLGMDEQGYRVVINNGAQAGQSVWHLHVHLLSGRSFHWPPG
jgi:histidine triad (HIT) family protein